MKKRMALFPGSFDPFTNGHREVVFDALSLFDVVVIAVGENSKKSSMFSAEERREMIQETFMGYPVEAHIFSGLVADYAQKIGVKALVRGLRTESDFSYEMPMAITNRILAKNLQTIFLPTSQENHYLSSTLVKEVFLHGGDVSAFVPESVFKKIAALNPK